jgi:hypothetical protein
LYSSLLLKLTACLLYSSSLPLYSGRLLLSLGILLTYIDATRTRTYRKHVTRSLATVVLCHRLRESVFSETLLRNGLHNPVVPPLLCADDIENTASCSAVFTELLPGNALIKSYILKFFFCLHQALKVQRNENRRSFLPRTSCFCFKYYISVKGYKFCYSLSLRSLCSTGSNGEDPSQSAKVV